MRKAIMSTAAVLAAVFLWVLLTLPSSPATATGEIADGIRRRTVAGAFHVHSTRSDGSGDKQAIAAAASRAGLRFVVLTDHGDATRPPDRPEYLSGVLMVDAVEISTNGGHYIALDMPAAPYPLGGEAAAVVEDVHRLGGFGVVAHPDSAKGELKWGDWIAPGIGGFEWLNIDSEWRDESRGRLARATIDYALRPGPALASILDRPSETLARWDARPPDRPLVALAGHDAHGGWSRRSEDAGRQWTFGVPSYEASFRAFAMRVILDAAPAGSADRDARMLLDAMRKGRVFTAMDAIAGPAWIDYRVDGGNTSVAMGDVLPMTGAPAGLSFRSTLPARGRVALLRGGAEVAASASGELRASLTEPGAYRVEVSAPRAPGNPPVPWIVTNPIYLTGDAPIVERSLPLFRSVTALTESGPIEKDSVSTAALVSSGGRHAVSYGLRPGDRASQYVALVIPVQADAQPFDAVVFKARADAPMRLSLQLRYQGVGGARWGHSVYVSPEESRVVVPVDRLIAMDRSGAPPRSPSPTSVMFVVDLTNARPGAQGRFEISELSLAVVASR